MRGYCENESSFTSCISTQRRETAEESTYSDEIDGRGSNRKMNWIIESKLECPSIFIEPLQGLGICSPEGCKINWIIESELDSLSIFTEPLQGLGICSPEGWFTSVSR